MVISGVLISKTAAVDQVCRIQDNPRAKLLAAFFLECCHLLIRNPAALKDLPYF